MVLERDIVAKILKYLRSLDHCFAWKEHGGIYGTAGIPDIIACYKGQFIAFEVKRQGNKPTELQQATMKKIASAGGKTYVVYSVDDVKKIIERGDV